MQNFRKIKALKDKQAQKLYALSEIQFKKKQQTTKSEENRLSESMISAQNNNDHFVIKNLDSNKLECYKTEEEMESSLLKTVVQLPQIQKVFQNIWDKYLTDLEREEEQYLEACYQGDVKRVKECISNKTKHPLDPKKCVNDQGKNGIHLATLSGTYRNLEIIRVLTYYGVDINGKTSLQLRTPLMLAAIVGNEQAAQELLILGAQATIADYQGNTALHHACIYNQETIAKNLLQYKAPTKVKNIRGLTPLDLSREGLLEMISKHKEDNQEAAYEAEKMLESRLQSKAEMETEEGIWSMASKGQKLDQVAIKQVGLSSFKKLSMLGRGAFGEVYLSQNIHEGKRYAIKVLDKGAIMRQNILRYAMTERKILSTINHPFVVKLRWAFQTREKLYLVMDYCPGGDLLGIIKKKGVFQQDPLRKYMAEIVLAIEELHRAQIIYRDLKPSNIIIDSQGHACLTDFGLSKQASLSHSFCGSTAYLAPEMLWRRGHTKVLDWYLLGVVIYECLTGKPPFWDSNKDQLLSNIKSGRYKPLSSDYSKQVRDLIEKLLRSNSSKRLGVNGSKDIKGHPWFKELNWSEVQQRQLKMPPVDEIKGKIVKQQLFQQDQSAHSKITGWDYSQSTKSI